MSVHSPPLLATECGTSVVTNEKGYPSLIRIGAIAEQVANLVHSGKEVMLVSSGAGEKKEDGVDVDENE